MEFLADESSEGGEILMRPMAVVEHLDGPFAAVTIVALA